MKRREFGGVRDQGIHVLVCASCPRVSSVTARGWRAYRIDHSGSGERPALEFCCPDCEGPELPHS